MPVTARYQSSWTERNIDAVVSCFDNAFAAVLDTEFQRITQGLSQPEINNWLKQSEGSINLLQSSGRSPNYADPMVCLRYVVMYQLRQINLAYSLVKGSQRGYHPDVFGKNLQVVDFGAGCLAMAFGVALAVADAIDAVQTVGRVRINCIDTSRYMMGIGYKIWKRASHDVSVNEHLRPLKEAITRLNLEFVEFDKVSNSDDADCWLTSLHTLYEGSRGDISLALSNIVENVKPTQIFLTCNQSKLDIAKWAWPSDDEPIDGDESILRWEGTLCSSKAAQVAKNHCFLTWKHPNLYTDVKGLKTLTTHKILNDKERCASARAELARLAVMEIDLNKQIKTLNEKKKAVRAVIRSVIGNQPYKDTIENSETSITASVELRFNRQRYFNQKRVKELAVERFGASGKRLIEDSTETKERTALYIKDMTPNEPPTEDLS